MQISTFSAQLGLGSELVEFYWDARSVPYSHLLTDVRHEQTIDYVIVQTPDPFLESFLPRLEWNSQKLCIAFLSFQMSKLETL